MNTVTTVLALASAVLFTLVGRVLHRRQVSPEARLANQAFVTWWYALAGTTILGSITSLGLLPHQLELYLAFAIVTLLGLCVSLWGLLYYLVYLFTERRGAALPLGLAYLAYFAFIVYYVLLMQPVGVTEQASGWALEYANELSSGPIFVTAIVALLLPQLLAAVGYLSLYWKVDDRLQKRRILLVSTSILVWFGSAGAATTGGEAIAGWWPIVSRLIGLAAAGTIYYAYTAIQPGSGSATGAPVVPNVGAQAAKPPRGNAAGARPLLAQP